jgi:spermidine synthase
LLALYLVAVCFFLSGVAALIYQIAWLRSLNLVFGTSHLSVATVLAAYMGGLAAGAWLAARYGSRIKRPLLVYGLLELIIAATAVLVPFSLGMAQDLLVASVGHQPAPPDASGPRQILFYLIASFVILGIPTTAMGATLPLLAKEVVNASRELGPRVGLLYGLNTLGAVAGALIGGFLLLPNIELLMVLLVGAVLNVAVFVIVVALLRQRLDPLRSVPAAKMAEKDQGKPATDKFDPIMILMFVSGVVSFGLEVLWTRLLTHIFGGTIYAFSIMLSAFLVGIALGSLIAGRFASDRARALRYFTLAQFGIAATSLAGFIVLGLYVPDTPSLLLLSIYAFCMMVPSTLFIGATFPLAVRIVSPKLEATANAVGRVYAFNTVGAIAGALLAGFILLPALGFVSFLQLLVLISGAIAVASLFLPPRPMPRVPAFGTLAVLAVVVLLVPQRPDRILYSHVGTTAAAGQERYFGVGTTSTVLLREENGFAFLSTDGLAEAVIPRRGSPPIRSSQTWLGALPLLARPEAEEVLIVGFGGGSVIEGVPPSVRTIDVIELEKEIIAANAAFADQRAYDPLSDDRVHVVRNDARNAMVLTDNRYDVVISQPSHPWTGAASHLYTREFLAIAKAKLNEGGTLLQWINAEFVDEDLLRSFAATILAEFDHVELYQPEPRVLLFVASEAPIDLLGAGGGVERALANQGAHYRAVGMRTAEDIAAMMLLDTDGVEALAGDHEPNTDQLNRLAFHSSWRGDGLSLDAIRELLSPDDPLLNPESKLRTWLGDDRLPYVAQQLFQAAYIERACNLGNTVESSDIRMTLAAMCLEETGQMARAQAALFDLLRNEPQSEPAQLALLLSHLPAFATRQLTPEIAALANRQRGPQRSIFEGWIFGAMGDFERLRALDDELRNVPLTSLGYPAAVKLRADWRVAIAAATNDRELAKEGLVIVDSLLSTFTNPELYLLRAAAAHFAQDQAALHETTGLLIRYVQERSKDDGNDGVQEVAFIAQRLEMLAEWIKSAPGSESSERAADLIARIDGLG